MKRTGIGLLLGLLLGGAIVRAQKQPPFTVDKNTAIIRPDVAVDIQIEDGDGKLAVRIKPDGSVEYGEGFNANTAAKEFWTQISKAYPEVCAPKANNP